MSVSHKVFVLNLENLENRAFYEKSGKTWNSKGIFIIFIQVKEKLGKINDLVHVLFSSFLFIVTNSYSQRGCSICCQ